VPAPDTLMTGLVDLQDARPGYEMAWAYWSGTVDETFASPAVRKKLAHSMGEYRVNVAKVPVMVLADRLLVAGVSIRTRSGGNWPEADAAFTESVWDGNNLELHVPRLIRNTLIFGDGYWFIWPGDAYGQVSIAWNDPRTARLVYDPEDQKTPLYGVKRWKDATGVLRARLLYPDHLERWMLKPEKLEEDPKSWIRDPDEPEDVPNDYGRVPLVHFRTDIPYGAPVHEDAWGAQNAVSKSGTTMMYAVEVAGFPQRYALTHPMASLDGNSADAPDWDDDGDADLATEDDSRIRTGPGELAILEGIAETGAWPSAGVDAFVRPADWFTAQAAASTATPQHYLDQRGGAPSGESLRVAQAPLTAKAESMQPLLADSFRDAFAFAMTIAGFPDTKPVVRWKPAGAVDDRLTWDIVAAKRDAGVPARTALEETGLYDPEEIDVWLGDPRVDMDLEHRVGLLTQVASSITGLASGVAQGILTEDAARQVVELTVGQLTPELDQESTPPAQPVPEPDAVRSTPA
jgi:hypothetical protein